MKKDYEITYIANPTLDEEAKNKLDEAVDAAIAKREGDILQSGPATDSPGSRRRLHYPIEGQRVSWMRALNIQLDPGHVHEIKNSLEGIEGIMRLSILQTSPRAEVTPAIFEAVSEKQEEEKAETAKPKEPKKEVTMEEVEEKIESALDEEVK